MLTSHTCPPNTRALPLLPVQVRGVRLLLVGLSDVLRGCFGKLSCRATLTKL